MNKLQKISFLFKVYVLLSAVVSAAMFFGLWLLGKSDNKLCRSMYNMIAGEYCMAWLVLTRPFMSQKAFDLSMKSAQDRFANSLIDIWRACGIVK